MLLELRAARAWQVRPSEFREWEHRDRQQAMALLAHEASIGPCGHSHVRMLDPREDLGGGWMDVRVVGVCPACEAAELFRQQNAEGLGAGVVVRVVNTKDYPDEEV